MTVILVIGSCDAQILALDRMVERQRGCLDLADIGHRFNAVEPLAFPLSGLVMEPYRFHGGPGRRGKVPAFLNEHRAAPSSFIEPAELESKNVVHRLRRLPRADIGDRRKQHAFVDQAMRRLS
jgi:hypothetical protein